MVPRKLELTNFLSYRETAVLSFAGIHLACISGANGAGKSSILDAITWTLFGRSRSRSDDDLVNRLAAVRGEPAEVRFTFSLEDSLYRVQRQKSVGKSGVLELQISDAANSWKTLSENKIRETQAEIEKLLRMNYDTFTNASFLLQGKADEFTTRTANQRKEILAELLGVNEWEIYREKAAEARKINEGQSIFLAQRVEKIDEELAEEPDRERALQQAQSRREEIAKKLALQEKLLSQMRQTATAVDQQELQVAGLKKSVERIRISLERTRQTFNEREEERAAHQVIIAEAPVIEARYSAWQAAAAEAQEWQEKANEYNRLLQQKRPFDLTIAQEKSRLEQQQKQLQELEQQVTAALTQRLELQKKISEHESRLQEVNLSLQKLRQVQEDYHQAREALQRTHGERRLLEQELNQLQTLKRQIERLEIEKVQVIKNKKAADQRSHELASELDQVAQNNKLYVEFKAELDSINNQQPLLRKEMNKLIDRIERLKASDQGGECPLCGQTLTEKHRHDVIRDLEEDGKQHGDVWRANSARITQLQKELPELEKSFVQITSLERERKAQEQRLAQAEAKLIEIDDRVKHWNKADKIRLQELENQWADDAEIRIQNNHVTELKERLQPMKELQEEQQQMQTRLTEDNTRLKAIERLISDWDSQGQKQLKIVRQQLSDNDYAREAREALADLQCQLDDIGYDAEAHQVARETQKTLAQAEDRLQQLRRAQAAAKPLEDTLADLKGRIQEQEHEFADQSAQLQFGMSQLETLKAGIVDLQETEDLVFQLREEEISANRIVGAAEQRLAVLGNLRSQREQIKKEKSATALRIQRLKLLEKSCGRSGVQALLIEQALPEIEERANDLLDRLTGGDMSIYFETQRKLKTRDALSETLDIRIIDKDGERPYNNYSGGEQFRVNFAIRIALSQLLAQRAGARLRTLIIDEGFGSQDPQGRQRLIEAINSVSQEFSCILVITHIDELRDAFPTRIEVTKTLEGSDITLS